LGKIFLIGCFFQVLGKFLSEKVEILGTFWVISVLSNKTLLGNFSELWATFGAIFQSFWATFGAIFQRIWATFWPNRLVTLV